MIAALFLDEWNDSRAENRNVDLVVASRAKKQLSQVSQVLSGFQFFTEPDQPGLSSSIRLEVMCIRIHLSTSQ